MYYCQDILTEPNTRTVGGLVSFQFSQWKQLEVQGMDLQQVDITFAEKQAPWLNTHIHVKIYCFDFK